MHSWVIKAGNEKLFDGFTESTILLKMIQPTSTSPFLNHCVQQNGPVQSDVGDMHGGDQPTIN